MVFAQFEPWGESRADLRAGIIASTIANVNRRKGKKAYKPVDFMPKFKSVCKEQTWEDMLRHVEMINPLLGGKDLRDGNIS